MSDLHYDTEREETLFTFDPYDMLPGRPSARRARHSAEGMDGLSAPTAPGASRALVASERLEAQNNASASPRDKGKQASLPMPIRPSTNIHDIFDVSPPNPGNAILMPIPSSFVSSTLSSFTFSSYSLSSPGSSSGSYEPFSSPSLSEVLALGFQDGPSPGALAPHLSLSEGKGKGREQAPTIPPLVLDSTDLGDDDVWMNFDSTTNFSGPSSLSSPLMTHHDAVAMSETRSMLTTTIGIPLSSSPTSSASTDEDTSGDGNRLHVPKRTRSLSSLSETSVSTAVNGKSKTRTFARKLLFGNRKAEAERMDRPSTPSGLAAAMSSQALDTTLSFQTAPPHAACSPTNSTAHTRQWYAAAPKTVNAGTFVSRPPPPIPVLSLETAFTHPPERRGILKHKGRSHSAPLPLPFFALDIVVPVTSTDIFEPLPLLVKNYFDDILPRELRLRVLQAVVTVHVAAHERMVESNRWSVNRASASRNQWVGGDRGIRELFKLSRVSKSWRSLVFDGQLWQDFDLSSFPGIPRQVLQRITEFAGPFIQTLNVSGLSHLDSEKLLDVASNLCLMSPQESLSHTQLTSINLQGCTGLTTRSLHHLLIRSRLLKALNVKGLAAVTNTTCEILATYCPNLTSLNMSRCMNMDAEGIEYMATAALDRGEHLQLVELRLCGLKHPTDEMMAALGKAAPHLEVLDLSYSRRLHNSALEAFVACDGEYGYSAVGPTAFDRDLGVHTILVHSRDLGRESFTGAGSMGSIDKPYLRRRVTNLRHLNLSFCMLLTDMVCVNLAWSVPRLEFLEMAGIGGELKDAGLVQLFERTPLIRRVDLEDAVDIGDAVVAALTPPPPPPPASPPSPLSPSESGSVADVGVVEGKSSAGGKEEEADLHTGHALEWLGISSCVNITDHAMLSLVRNCPKLTTLEADGTRISSIVFREFVGLSRERQLLNARIMAVDCRGIGEPLVKELSQAGCTRPRMGWRAYGARRLYFLDGRDGNEEDLKIGQDECDEGRVVVKTFYSWQTVDAVKASREKRKAKAAAAAAAASGMVGAGKVRGRDAGVGDWDDVVGVRSGRSGRMRWWSPGGRRLSSSSGTTSPMGVAEMNDGCRTM